MQKNCAAGTLHPLWKSSSLHALVEEHSRGYCSKLRAPLSSSIAKMLPTLPSIAARLQICPPNLLLRAERNPRTSSSWRASPQRCDLRKTPALYVKVANRVDSDRHWSVIAAQLHAVGDFHPLQNLVAWPKRSQEDVFWVSRVSANGPDALQNSCQCLQARQAACICIATRERRLPYSSTPFSIPV